MTKTFPLDVVLDQVSYADQRFGPFKSTHEGYGVLCEEKKELLDAIHANDREAVEREACQVAAVALRLAEACSLPAFAERSGFASAVHEPERSRAK